MENKSKSRVNLKDLSFSELEDLMNVLDAEKYRAKQVAEWIFKKGAVSIREMTSLSRDLRERLETVALVSVPEIKARVKSKRGDTVKYLFGLSDGQAV